LLMSAGRVHHE
jgi:hypothetical protein